MRRVSGGAFYGNFIIFTFHECPQEKSSREKWDVFLLTDADVVQSEERVHVVDICHELLVTKCEISHIPARLGSCQHLEQSWSGTRLRSQSVTKKKKKKKRVLFIIPSIITDTILLTFLATSNPGGTGQLMAKGQPTSPVQASLKTCALQQFSLPYSRQLKLTLSWRTACE